MWAALRGFKDRVVVQFYPSQEKLHGGGGRKDFLNTE